MYVINYILDADVWGNDNLFRRMYIGPSFQTYIEITCIHSTFVHNFPLITYLHIVINLLGRRRGFGEFIGLVVSTCDLKLPCDNLIAK